MSNKKLLSILLAIVILIGLAYSNNFSASAQTEPKTKFIKVNDTILEFNEIIYVDGANGSDTNGSGTRLRPYQSIKHAFDYLSSNCKQDGAVLVKNGIYDVKDMFTSKHENFNFQYDGMKVSLIPETMGQVTLNNSGQWIINANGDAIGSMKINVYGMIINTNPEVVKLPLESDNQMNEFYNCVINGPYGGWNYYIEDAQIKMENCVFTGEPCHFHLANPISGLSINCASATAFVEPGTGIKLKPLYYATFDSDYQILSSGWENSGIGKNPDGTAAHIGVYGGQFAWGSKAIETSDATVIKVVLETTERMRFSVSDDLYKNLEMTWFTSDSRVASVNNEGYVTAMRPGTAVITAANVDASYVENINVLVVEDAADYRLAVDLQVYETCRLTIDNYTYTVPVTWNSVSAPIAEVDEGGIVTGKEKGLTLVTATGEQGNLLGQIYIRVRD